MSHYAKTRPDSESSNSYCNSYLFHEFKPSTTDMGSIPRFKGVVPQQNGRWGAQIYANNQRLWLGTFKSVTDAASAYDSAALKLHNTVEPHRNFPWTDITFHESNFQSNYSTEAILHMIKDGSYPSKFTDFLTHQMRDHQECTPKTPSYRLLFQKALTPSDVGKLNRLVIPKKFALKYFPNIGDETDGVDVQLPFYDKLMRLWTFRYCYWKSSQSYVFTQGWKRFVRENKLKANDVVAFYVYENQEGSKHGQMFCVIDVHHNAGSSNVGMVGLVQNENYGLVKEEKEEFEDSNPSVRSSSPSCDSGKKGFKLFGVQII